LLRNQVPDGHAEHALPHRLESAAISNRQQSRIGSNLESAAISNRQQSRIGSRSAPVRRRYASADEARMHLGCVTLVLVMLGLGGCQHRGGEGALAPLAEVQGGGEIAIRRGPDVGMYLKVRPPHAVGPYSNIVIRKGRLSGIHCGGGLDITAGPDRISGFGPGGGVVEMEVWGDEAEVNAEGLWNGAYGHLEATPEMLRVSLGLRPTRVVRGRVIPSVHRSWSFRRGGDGTFVGTPTVNGTPQWTALLVDEKVNAYLTRAEVLTLVMTLLAGGIDGSGLGDPFACGARG
jgi:hypothetical protein